MAISSLNSAISGLKAARLALDVASTNIANASTAGYTRKILPQEAIVSANGEALGVRVQQVIRNVDTNLLRDVFNSNSVQSGLSVQQSFLDRIQVFQGPSEAEVSISAEVSKLSEAFISAANSPEDPFALNNVLNQAFSLTRKINDFSELIVNSRNDVQSEMTSSIASINSQLEVIAQLNRDISQQIVIGGSPANLQDKRDQAVLALSEEIDIRFFPRENGKITVMTASGITLVDDSARQIDFTAQRLLPTSYYPGNGANAVQISITPPIDITADGLGGRLGALIELRDDTYPKYMAQVDELAQKLSSRFESQGLNLFVDGSGNVPANVPPPGAITYVGFSADIRVNPNIVDDPSLLRSGTTGNVVLAGSNEVLNKIVEFAFGPNAYKEANGAVDISAGTIFAATGLSTFTQTIGTIDITQLNPLDTDPSITPPAQFTLDDGTGPLVITINAGDTATDLVNNINAIVGAGSARLNTLGQLVLESSNGNITLGDVSIGAAGMTSLGFNFGVTASQDPEFTIQVGNENPITISISSTDTQANLLATLNAVPNITATLNGAGGLQITPNNGGDLSLVDGRGGPIQAMGITVTDVPHETFRQNNLGPDGNVSSDLVSITSLEEFSRAIVTLQSEEVRDTERLLENESVFFNTLSQRAQNENGVNIDEEVAKLIEIQTAYTASARMLSVSEEMLDTLFNSI